MKCIGKSSRNETAACRISGINDNLIPLPKNYFVSSFDFIKTSFLVSMTLIIYVQVSLSEQSFAFDSFTLITEILTFLEDEDSLVPMVSLVYF